MAQLELIHPTHQRNWRWVIYFAPNRVRTLWPAWPCTVLALFKVFQQCKAFPSGLLLKDLLGKKWKGLARWFKSPIPTDPSLKWGNCYHYNHYCQVIPLCQDSCCTGEGGFPGPKLSTHHCPSQVGAVAASWKDWFSRNWNTWAWYGYSIRHLYTRR